MSRNEFRLPSALASTSEAIPTTPSEAIELSEAPTPGLSRAERRRAGKKREPIAGPGSARQPRIPAPPPRQFAHRRRG
ncbi:hypothetical protein BKA25_003750 [Actinoalloteichus hymeniacidonis]|uniref:Uncharacterized protein n=1 Tax=Actinoalloteichus hymeniacidonis TaxID=340345 RepID=A0AAC9MXQ8_9PSEU|nr:hypothetical protein TL08_08600 [Actinoalloteichus hymeniacidonis]MBB5909434.1 hypothetical protein [Actinoalloteichus hymeniacidonis]